MHWTVLSESMLSGKDGRTGPSDCGVSTGVLNKNLHYVSILESCFGQPSASRNNWTSETCLQLLYSRWTLTFWSAASAASGSLLKHSTSFNVHLAIRQLTAVLQSPPGIAWQFEDSTTACKHSSSIVLSNEDFCYGTQIHEHHLHRDDWTTVCKNRHCVVMHIYLGLHRSNPVFCKQAHLASFGHHCRRWCFDSFQICLVSRAPGNTLVPHRKDASAGTHGLAYLLSTVHDCTLCGFLPASAAQQYGFT